MTVTGKTGDEALLLWSSGCGAVHVLNALPALVAVDAGAVVTEDEYQAIIIPLRDEMEKRAGFLVDYLVSLPPKREAIAELREFAWWCVRKGAANVPAVIERDRRKSLAQHGAA